VKEKEVVILDAKTKKISSLPYAVCVWNTGITQTPLIQSLTQKIPVQNHQRALLTDSRLLVKGTRNIFAIGDCSSIELPMLRNRLVELFWKYDTNDDGVISKQEFQSMFEDLSDKYPQLQGTALNFGMRWILFIYTTISSFACSSLSEKGGKPVW
jgi:hypothetical protein